MVCLPVLRHQCRLGHIYRKSQFLAHPRRCTANRHRTPLRPVWVGQAPPFVILRAVDIGRAIYQAEAHRGVGGAGTAACSGDLLLGALAACAQITCQMVAAAMGIPLVGIEVQVEGDLDLRGTLGMAKDVPVGFEQIRLSFALTAPQATAEQLQALREKTEQYCVVMQTLTQPPEMQVNWARS